MNVCADVITSFAVGLPTLNWTSVLASSNVSDTTLHLVSDLRNVTCAQIDLDNGDVQLRGELNGNFNSLLVMLTIATTIAFGPGPDQATCHPITSSLLTHQRSDCNQTFCAVPAACRYIGYKAVSTAPTLWEYEFICVCGQAWCNELLLWLRPDSVQGQRNRAHLCEVSVVFIWFVWQCHYPGHLLITLDCELINYRSDLHTEIEIRFAHWTWSSLLIAVLAVLCHQQAQCWGGDGVCGWRGGVYESNLMHFDMCQLLDLFNSVN